MIVDNTKPQHADCPPSYEETGSRGKSTSTEFVPVLDGKPSLPVPFDGAVVGHTIRQPAYTASPSVHHYVSPNTGEHVASLLPPDHPEMICLQVGQHEPTTMYGILGLLAAVLWFPLGIGCCLLDRKVTCKRCGVRINNGVCD